MGGLYGYDRREWLNMQVFRYWRFVRPLLRTTSSPRSAFTLSAVGAVLAVASLSLTAYAWPAAIVAVGAMYPTVGYSMIGRAKRVAMHVAVGHDSSIKPRDFINAPRSVDTGFRLVRPADASWAQLYPYVDLSDHSLFIQMENDLTREQRYELYERWYSLCPKGFMHLEKQGPDGNWRPISVSIMLPLSGPGYRTITAKSEPHRLSVVDLDWDGIPVGSDRRESVFADRHLDRRP